MLAGQTTLTMLARQAVHNKKVIAALRATPYFADLGEIQMQMLARSGKVRLTRARARARTRTLSLSLSLSLGLTFI